jgi:hypothetical protein
VCELARVSVKAGDELQVHATFNQERASVRAASEQGRQQAAGSRQQGETRRNGQQAAGRNSAVSYVTDVLFICSLHNTPALQTVKLLFRPLPRTCTACTPATASTAFTYPAVPQCTAPVLWPHLYRRRPVPASIVLNHTFSTFVSFPAAFLSAPPSLSFATSSSAFLITMPAVLNAFLDLSPRILQIFALL